MVLELKICEVSNSYVMPGPLPDFWGFQYIKENVKMPNQSYKNEGKL